MKVEEIRDGKNTKYLIDEKRLITCPLYRTVIDEKEYWILYDSNMNIIEPFYDYINHNRFYVARNTLRTVAYEIRLLYCFCEIFNLDINNLQFRDLNALISFLLGESQETKTMELYLLTKRSRQTVLTFLHTYRQYFEYAKIKCLAFENYSSYNVGYGQAKAAAMSLNTGYKKVPKYISVDEYKTIINYIRASDLPSLTKIRQELIIRLMFEGGLRIGEVLGLTLEDVIPEVSNGKEYCKVIIRNRYTDRIFQNAKGCMKVKQRSNYRKNEYNVLDVGYQEAFVSMDLYNLYADYVDEVHDKAYRKHRNRYAAAKADAVGKFKESNETNYYVFLNGKYSPLSIASWNKELRVIFENTGLEIDYNFKKNNLNHRFRHGFAMHLIHDLGLRTEIVQRRMRHRSPSSTAIYYNPTDEQIVDMKEQLEEQLITDDIIL